MYGYVVPPKGYLSIEEYALFDSFYCGLCKTTGKAFGQMMRFTTNYDLTFLAIILSDLTSQEVEFTAENCILNYKKRSVVQPNVLMKKISQTNAILSFYKAQDGVRDKEGLKYTLARSIMKKAYNISAAALPEIDKAVCEGYKKLNMLEKNEGVSLDRVSDCFARIMTDITDILLGEKTTDNTSRFFYNIGKFVYLIDAIDDIDEDFKSKRYNPLLFGRKFISRKQFLHDYLTELDFIVNSVINRAIECFNEMNFSQSYTLLKNIVFYGLRQKAEEALNSEKKLKRPVV